VLFKGRAKRDEALSDEALVSELQRRMDAERFGVLYDRYAAKVFQKCMGMTRDRDLAKDLAHDIFLKAFLNLPKFDHRSRFGTWLYSITYNYCLDHLRKAQRQRNNNLDDRLEESLEHADTSEAELLSLRAEHLESAIALIDPDDRALLLMKYQDDLSIKDIMEILAVGESAVKMRILRARERALAKYHELYPEER
jgi:RNA polymerase sigma factor (sigma-70 family)